jgi:hypothetical protein
MIKHALVYERRNQGLAAFSDIYPPLRVCKCSSCLVRRFITINNCNLIDIYQHLHHSPDKSESTEISWIADKPLPRVYSLAPKLPIIFLCSIDVSIFYTNDGMDL